MYSPCLSAAGFRFLDLPTPTEGLGRSCDWLTGRIDHHTDLIGISTFRSSEMRLGWVPSIRRGHGVPGTGNVVSYPCHSNRRMEWTSPPSPLVVANIISNGDLDFTTPHQRFTLVHPSSLSLARFAQMIWAYLRRFPTASHLTVSSDARRGGN